MNGQTVTLALDQGTHASRALLFDQYGVVVFSSAREVTLTRIDEHRVEQDANEIWQSIQDVLNDSLQHANDNHYTISSAGIATQRSTVVAWDRHTGKPLAPALSWQDTRGHTLVAQLASQADLIKQRTGLKLSAHYGASKLRWLLEHQMAVADANTHKRLAMGPLVSFLLFHLLQDNPLWVDHGNAARTQLWNIETRDWDQELLKLFSLSDEYLPRCAPIRHAYGMLKDTDIPLTAVNGDQAAAVYGLGDVEPGTATINIGTGAFALMTTGDQLVAHPALLGGVIDSDAQSSRYCLEGTVNGAGAALDWAEAHWNITSHLEVDWTSVAEPPLFINAVGGMGSPWWRPGGQPHVSGYSNTQCSEDPAPCIAAVIESIIFMLHANLEAARTSGIKPHTIRIGGGLSRYDALCQRLANLSDLPVLRSNQAEVTGRGIAWLAADTTQSWHEATTEVFAPKHDDRLTARYQNFITAMT